MRSRPRKDYMDVGSRPLLAPMKFEESRYAHEMSLCTGYEFSADARCAVARKPAGTCDWERFIAPRASNFTKSVKKQLMDRSCGAPYVPIAA
jgi:hypothetical protein